MSRLEELIRELCPDGVEFKEVQEVVRTVSPKGKLKSNNYLESGKYPIIDQGQAFIAGYTDEEIAFPFGEYVIFGDHTCIVKYVDFAFVQGADGVKVLLANQDILTKYLYHCMSNIYMSADYARHWSKIKVKKIPVPPLAIQREIVHILDNFTELTAELTAELTTRKKQYEYYRDKLLLLDCDCEWRTLGEIGKVSMCKRIMKSETSRQGDVPFFKIGTFGKKPDAYISWEKFEEYRTIYPFPKKSDILISAAGTIGRTVIYDGKPAYYQDSNIVWLENDESDVLNKYLYYYYQLQPWSIATGGTIARL